MSKMLPVAVLALTVLVTFTGCSRKIASPNQGPMTAGLDDFTSLSDDVMIDTTSLDNLDDPSKAAYGARFEDTRTRIEDSGLSTLYFSFDSYLVPETEVEKVNAAVQYLNTNPAHVMIIEGHCDERGSNEYNVSLSEQRALAVKNYMMNLGITEDRIQTRAFGEENPVSLGIGEEIFRLNRRGEFVPYQ